MKKQPVFVVMLVVLLALGLVLSGCSSAPSSGSSTASSSAAAASGVLVLYENGQWAGELGGVTISKQEGGNSDTMTETNGTFVFMGAPLYNFEFANIIDASGYTKLVFETQQKTSEAHGWWLGGQLFTYYAAGYTEDDGSTVNLAKYGFWTFDDFRSGRLGFALAKATVQDAPEAPPSVAFDAKQFKGFSFKANGGNPSTILKITLE